MEYTQWAELKGQITELKRVLILVVMEYTQWVMCYVKCKY